MSLCCVTIYQPLEHPVGCTLTLGSGPVVVYQPELCYNILTTRQPVGCTLTSGSGPVVVYQPVLCYYILTSRTSCGVYYDPRAGACGSLSACVVLLYTNL